MTLIEINYFLEKIKKDLSVGGLRLNFSPYFRTLLTLNLSSCEEVERVKTSSLVNFWKEEGQFLNFNLEDDYLKGCLWPLDWSSFPLEKKICLIETSSFNPTGEPHAGNIHTYLHGSIFYNLLSLAGGKVVNAYYINDLGAQFSQLIARTKEDPEKLLSLNMQKIVSTLIPYRFKMPDIFFRESSFVKRSSEIISNLKTVKSLKGCYYKGELGAYFLRKRKTGETTYLANDLAFHESLAKKGFYKAFTTLGSDHKGHMLKLQELMSVLNLKERLDFFTVGKIYVKEEQGIVKFSKRRGEVFISPALTKNWRLISLSRSTIQENVVSEKSFQILRRDWRNIFTAHFRIHNLSRMKVSRRKSILEEKRETVFIISQLPEYLRKSYLSKEVNLLFRFLVRTATVINQSYLDNLDYINLHRVMKLLNEIFHYV